MFGSDDLGQVGSIHLWNRERFGDELVGVSFQSGDHTTHYTVIAQMAYQGAGIDVPENRYFELLQVLFCDLLGAPVGAHARKLADNQAFDIRARSFVVFGVGAVVADFRIGENDDLASVGRIGEDFLIAGDGSIKNYFPVTFAFGSVAFASEDSTVFQRKDGLHLFSGAVDFIDSSREEEIGQEVFLRKSWNLGKIIQERFIAGDPSCPQASNRTPPCRK